jgi:hypothetical protein
MNLANRSASSNLKGNTATTPAPATTHHRIFYLVLEDKVETTNKINSPNILLSNPSISINRHNATPINNTTVQATQ